MSLNCNEIDLILKELDLTGSFVQEVVQPNFETLALYIYKNVSFEEGGGAKTVFISLSQSSTRINETRKKITKNSKPLRFNECLKSKIKGCKITECRQLGKERVILIKLHRDGKLYIMPNANNGETFGEDDDYNLYIRLWNNAANVILTDKENVIIDSFFRRPQRNEITGKIFNVPEIKTYTDAELKELDAKFPVRTFDELEESDKNLSFNEKVELWYSNFAQTLSLSSLLEQCEKWYESHKSRQVLALEKLRQKKNEFLESSRLKHFGDLILSFGYMIDGKSGFLECEDYETGNTVRIKIDPEKSAQENASKYYELYKKENSGLEDLEHDIKIAENNLADLEKKYAQMLSEKNPVKLEQILRKDSAPKQKQEKNIPGLQYLINGWTILVGRDANENDELLRHHAKGFDTWLHVRDYSGGYVFIKNRAGKTVPLEILLYAGNLAVYFSKARKNRKADLYYTQVKYLRRAKNGPKGLVLPTNEKNICIELSDKKMRELDEFRLD